MAKRGFRGTTTYVQVMSELVAAAQYRGLTTYQDIAVIMGIATWGNVMQAETGCILGEISEDEIAAGRPMLSAVAVGVSGKPGTGFYALAKHIGRMDQNDAEEAFWARERDAVYAAWKRRIRPKSPKKA